MEQLELSKSIDSYFPAPKSNRGILASSYLETHILIKHKGSFHLDDVKHFYDDEALTQALGIKQIPKASALGNWLRRMGNNSQGMKSLSHVNKRVLKAALHRCKELHLILMPPKSLAIRRMRNGHTIKTKAICRWWGI